MTEVAAGLIVDDDGRVLACLRPAGKHLGGKWEFPGGKVEPGESPADALMRELEEELSIRVAVGRAFTPVVWDYGQSRIRLHPFECRIVSGNVVAHEHSEIRWCRRDELSGLDWAAADIPVLKELLQSPSDPNGA